MKTAIKERLQNYAVRNNKKVLKEIVIPEDIAKRYCFSINEKTAALVVKYKKIKSLKNYV